MVTGKDLEDQGVLIYSLDWDLLIIFDACRADFFEKYSLPYLKRNLNVTEYRRVWSRGSYTGQWFWNTFNSELRNCVYVCNNPAVIDQTKDFSRYEKNFSKVIRIFKSTWGKLGYCNTYRPDLALFSAKVQHYLGYRVIVHLLQPHPPYCFVKELARYEMHVAGMYQDVRCGRLSRELVVKGYVLNLCYITVVTADFIRSLPKGLKIVVTSDHGELLGENNQYGHFTGEPHPVLRTVPFLVVKT